MPDNQFKRGELYSIITGMASTAISRCIQKNFRAAGLELSVEQWSVLYHLWKEDGLSQQELCNRSFRDKPSITRLLHNMEKQGLVKRVISKNDRRMNHIYLTDTAKSLKDTSTQVANSTLNVVHAAIVFTNYPFYQSLLFHIVQQAGNAGFIPKATIAKLLLAQPIFLP